MNRLKEISCYFLDLDGTVYLGNKLIPGAGRLIKLLRERNLGHYFLTNNSSRDKEAYVTKLARLGIAVDADQVITSGEATALWLHKTCPGARIFLLGTPALGREFRQHGFQLVGRDGNPQYVVLGFDTTLTYQKVWDACDLLRTGVSYVATHPDINCPLEHGGFMPDAGAIMAMIHASTGYRPKIIGKPSREMIDAALTRSRCPRERAAIVGDRLYTDIAMGQKAEITSILVLSGATAPGEAALSPCQPDFIFQSVAELADSLVQA